MIAYSQSKGVINELLEVCMKQTSFVFSNELCIKETAFIIHYFFSPGTNWPSPIAYSRS